MRFGIILLMCASFLAGCGDDPNEVKKVLQTILYDVGGAVIDEADDAPLEAVTITINGYNAFVQTETTDAFGLWRSENLAPGVYIITYELATYDTEVDPFSLEAIGENDVANPFISLGTLEMSGPGAIASVDVPFSITLEDGDNAVDGQAGFNLVYSLSADSDIVITFDTPVFGGNVELEDDDTGDTLVATVDGTNQVFTLARTDIDAMDSGGGLFADSNPNTQHRIRLQGFSYQLNGNQRDFDADLRFNCTP